MKLPALDKRNQFSAYDKIAQLSTKINDLKEENNELKQKLSELLNHENPNIFCQFKKSIIDFHQRLKDREDEFSIFSKYINSYRTNPDPTFVEVEALQKRKSNFDPITSSLLVSNQELSFFNQTDLQRQNDELKFLVEKQEQELKLLERRLKLYTKYQNQNMIKNTISLLENGEIPTIASVSSPTITVELEEKLKILKEDFSKLLKRRKELNEMLLRKKLKKREKRNRIKCAIKIESIVRTFLVKLHLKEMNQSATKIQRVWRGYILRYKQTLALQNASEDGEESYEEEEEEYYEEEEEEKAEEKNKEEKSEKKDDDEYEYEYEVEEEENEKGKEKDTS